MNPFALGHEDLPRWYTLSYDAARATIVVRTHPLVRDVLVGTLMDDNPGIDHYRATFGFEALVPPSELRGWGFPMQQSRACGERLETGPDGWTIWSFRLPRIGLGGREQVDWGSSHAFSATLALFFSALDQSVHDLKSEDFGDSALQLMTVNLVLQNRHICGGWLGASLSQETIRRLPRAMIITGAENDITDAMHCACETLWGLNLTDETGRFTVRFDPPEDLHMHMPMGNAVGLDPEWTGRIPGWGYHLVPHNVDTTLHQLTLLAGLARLHEHLERIDPSS